MNITKQKQTHKEQIMVSSRERGVGGVIHGKGIITMHNKLQGYIVQCGNDSLWELIEYSKFKKPNIQR